MSTTSEPRPALPVQFLWQCPSDLAQVDKFVLSTPYSLENYCKILRQLIGHFRARDMVVVPDDSPLLQAVPNVQNIMDESVNTAVKQLLDILAQEARNFLDTLRLGTTNEHKNLASLIQRPLYWLRTKEKQWAQCCSSLFMGSQSYKRMADGPSLFALLFYAANAELLPAVNLNGAEPGVRLRAMFTRRIVLTFTACFCCAWDANSLMPRGINNIPPCPNKILTTRLEYNMLLGRTETRYVLLETQEDGLLNLQECRTTWNASFGARYIGVLYGDLYRAAPFQDTISVTKTHLAHWPNCIEQLFVLGDSHYSNGIVAACKAYEDNVRMNMMSAVVQPNHNNSVPVKQAPAADLLLPAAAVAAPLEKKTPPVVLAPSPAAPAPPKSAPKRAPVKKRKRDDVFIQDTLTDTTTAPTQAVRAAVASVADSPFNEPIAEPNGESEPLTKRAKIASGSLQKVLEEWSKFDRVLNSANAIAVMNDVVRFLDERFKLFVGTLNANKLTKEDASTALSWLSSDAPPIYNACMMISQLENGHKLIEPTRSSCIYKLAEDTSIWNLTAAPKDSTVARILARWLNFSLAILFAWFYKPKTATKEQASHTQKLANKHCFLTKISGCIEQFKTLLTVSVHCKCLQ